MRVRGFESKKALTDVMVKVTARLILTTSYKFSSQASQGTVCKLPTPIVMALFNFGRGCAVFFIHRHPLSAGQFLIMVNPAYKFVLEI